MENLSQSKASLKSTERNGLAAALGFFDGVHRGHAALLDQTLAIADRFSLTPAVITLDRQPASALFGTNIPLINTVQDRERIIKARFGISDIISLEFNECLQKMSWQAFICMLKDKFRVEYVIVGSDYRFGAEGKGNAAKLAASGMNTLIVPPVQIDGETVSSTRIRKLIAAGQIEDANILLGHPHFMYGDVVHGRRLGHSIGIPTINLLIPENVEHPAFGVYATVTTIKGKRYSGITNVGLRPTVSKMSGFKGITVETHLIGFSEEIYGENISLEFMRFIRPEKKFDTLDALKVQINHDICSIYPLE